MRRSASGIAGIAALLVVCSAHIGSPDSWYEGGAGPYHVLVNVHMPSVIPGIAEIYVHVEGDIVRRVTAMINVFDAAAGTPPPDVGAPVQGAPGSFRTRLWIMAPGSNSVTVRVDGARGAGSAIVPITAVASSRLPMQKSLSGLLLALGAFLVLGIVSITGAAVRESVLPPGAVPDKRRVWRARFAMLASLVVFVLVIGGGKRWWDGVDADFRENLYRPFAISLAESTDGGRANIRLTITDSAWVMRHDSAWLHRTHNSAWSPLISDHGRLMHLFLVKMPGMSAFAHLHPATVDSVTFTSELPALPAGRYSVFGDIVHESGFAKTLVGTIDIAGADSRSPGGDSDDVSFTGPGAGRERVARLPDGSTVTWLRDTTPIRADAPASLHFVVRDASGKASSVQPYLGMAAHAVVMRDDGSVFIHLHPSGTGSMGAQEAFAIRQRGDTGATRSIGKEVAREDAAMARMQPATLQGDVILPYAFPRAGSYRIWVQVKRGGAVQTAAFDAVVQPSLVASR